MSRLLEAVADHGDKVGVVVLSAGPAVPLGSAFAISAVVVGLVLYLASLFAGARVRKGVRQRLVDLRSMTGPETALYKLSEDLALPPPWRLSVYCTTVDDPTASWHRVARVSNVQEFQSSGRTRIPSGQGVLWMAEATSNGDELLGVPDPEADEAGFFHFHSTRRVPEDVAKSLRMPTCAYVGLVYRMRAVDDARGLVSVGLVAETANRDRQGDMTRSRLKTAAPEALMEQIYRSSVVDAVLAETKVVQVLRETG